MMVFTGHFRRQNPVKNSDILTTKNILNPLYLNNYLLKFLMSFIGHFFHSTLLYVVGMVEMANIYLDVLRWKSSLFKFSLTYSYGSAYFPWCALMKLDLLKIEVNHAAYSLEVFF